MILLTSSRSAKCKHIDTHSMTIKEVATILTFYAKISWITTRVIEDN